MIKVRYPNGQVVTHNGANFLEHGDTGWHLYDSEKKKKWICSIQASAGATIETVNPCSVENQIIQMPEGRAEEMVAEMFEEGRHISGEMAARIKRALQRFNMQTWNWR